MSTTTGSPQSTSGGAPTKAEGRKLTLPKFGRRDKGASGSSSTASGQRHVRLKLVYIDFFSALKVSFLLGLAQAIVTVIATFLLYLVFVQTGVFETANSVAGQVLGGKNFDVQSFASMAQVLSFAGVIGVLNMVVITVLGGVIAVIYNACAKIVGGIQMGFVNVPD
ncbi:MAG: DUF3566 domain-containing protein [Microbacteriaceae bacterium]|nr:DUF3566 domain-containing protein [Microbacteriaceae bacterium]